MSAKSLASEVVAVPTDDVDEWQTVKVVQNENGQSELVIENLEHLNEHATLILKRHGNHFKIGFANPKDN